MDAQELLNQTPPSWADTPNDTVRAVLMGESGDGKTGSFASLVAAGYRLMIHDIDNGTKILKSLLFDEDHYPYAKWMKQHGIDPRERVSIIPIDCEMVFEEIKIPDNKGNLILGPKIPKPKDSKAFSKIFSSLTNWVDPYTKIKYGNIGTWGSDVVYIHDSLTTSARQALYFNQDLNSRLGALEDWTDNSYKRDIGGGQSHLIRLLETIYGSRIHCNVLVICHTRGIDESQGYNQSPGAMLLKDPRATVDPQGYPTAIGVALSKKVGIYFNDFLVTQRSGSGRNTKREIRAVPTTINGIDIGTKNSAWLEESYPIESGLAEIFAALRHQPYPTELVTAIGRKISSSSKETNTPPPKTNGGANTEKIVI